MLEFFSEKNIKKFRNCVQNTDWSPLHSYNCVEDCNTFFDETLRNCFDASIKNNREFLRIIKMDEKIR